MQCICKLRDLDEIENKNSSLNQAIKQKFWKWIGIEIQLFDDSEYILHFDGNYAKHFFADLEKEAGRQQKNALKYISL